MLYMKTLTVEEYRDTLKRDLQGMMAANSPLFKKAIANYIALLNNEQELKELVADINRYNKEYKY